MIMNDSWLDLSDKISIYISIDSTRTNESLKIHQMEAIGLYEML